MLTPSSTLLVLKSRVYAQADWRTVKTKIWKARLYNSSVGRTSNRLEYVLLFSTFLLFTHCYSTAFIIIVPQSYILSEYNKTHMALLLYAFDKKRNLEGLSHEMNIRNLFMLQSSNNKPLKKAKKYSVQTRLRTYI